MISSYSEVVNRDVNKAFAALSSKAPPTPKRGTRRPADESSISPSHQPKKQMKESGTAVVTGPTPGSSSQPTAKDKSNDINPNQADVLQAVNTNILTVLSDLGNTVDKIADENIKSVLLSVLIVLNQQFDKIEQLSKSQTKINESKAKDIDLEYKNQCRIRMKNDLQNAANDVKVGPINIDFGSDTPPYQQAKEALSKCSDEMANFIKNQRIIVLANKTIKESNKSEKVYVIIKCLDNSSKHDLLKLIKQAGEISSKYNFPKSIYPIVKKLRETLRNEDNEIKFRGKQMDFHKQDYQL